MADEQYTPVSSLTVGTETRLSGVVRRIRHLGDLVVFYLLDCTGFVQVVVDSSKVRSISGLRHGDRVIINGLVRDRMSGTGIEVASDDVYVLGQR